MADSAGQDETFLIQMINYLKTEARKVNLFVFYVADVRMDDTT